jgi:hypothetical protein
MFSSARRKLIGEAMREPNMRVVLHPATIAVMLALASGAGHAQPASGKPLFFEGDMVRGAGEAGRTGATCVLASQFKRREMVVWRIRVRDEAGRDVPPEGLKSLVVELPDGQTFPARFGPHPRGKPTDSFWATSWIIPADYPTGALSYTVVATGLDGTVQRWSPFNVAPSNLTVVEGDVTFTK